MTRLVVYASTCACLARTCSQTEDAGCPIARDPQAMTIFSNAVKLRKEGDEGKEKYFLEIQLRSTEEKPDSVEKAARLFFRNSNFTETGHMCGSSAKCYSSCTYRDNTSIDVDSVLQLGAQEREGVVMQLFESQLKQLVRMLGMEEELFKRVDQDNPPKEGKVAVIGGGPGGRQTMVELVRRGYEVTLFDNQPFLSGAMGDLVPPDKTF